MRQLPCLWFLSLSFPGIALLPSWVADDDHNGADDHNDNDDNDDNDYDDNDDDVDDDDSYDEDDGGSSPEKGFLSHHFDPSHPCNGHWNTL